ncbi:XAC0095 family protein [Lysobacter enzymogenes]|uniref:XAC0095 family protein n=1 Tax=Lysobacter enzymogenes TaxID=69 RepID=UPI003D18DEC9
MLVCSYIRILNTFFLLVVLKKIQQGCAEVKSYQASIAATSQHYVLSPGAHQALTQIRDHLRFLAQLTEPKGTGDSDVIYLSADALANCFDRLAEDLDCIAQAAVPSGP